MATIKSYTDINQSRKLAEILPLESADTFIADVFDKEKETHSYNFHILSTWRCNTFEELKGRENKFVHFIPCWSLTALLDVLPDGTDIVKDKADTENEKYMCTVGIKNDIVSTFGNNPIDTCVDMILKLKQNKLL